MKKAFSSILVACLLLLPLAAQAALTYTDRASWEGAVDSFADVDLASQVGIYETLSAGSPISLPSGGQLSFDVDMGGRQVPGGGWATWSGGHEPRVLYSLGATSVTGYFSPSVWAFGLEMEPNPFSLLLMTLTLSDGTVLQQDVHGSAGAAFFGWTGADIVSMQISSAADFAIGRMVEGSGGAPVPEPCTMLLVGGGLLGLAGLRRKLG